MNNIRKKWAVTFLCLAVICLAGVLAACTGKTFTVSLDAAGGALAGESSISVKAGDALVLPVPEREDYIFEGWFDGDGPNAGRVADGTSVTADMTLTARWRADFSEGAEYILSADGSSYVCVGTGTFTGAALKLPTFYKGLPVTAVADGAFAENDLLVQVSLPRLLVSVGDGGGETGAFEGCERLQTVTFRGEGGLRAVGGRAFAWCAALAEIILPGTVKTVGDQAFYGCSGLTDAELPDGLEEIGVSAFEGCAALKAVDIPDGVTKIGAGAFAGCGRLEQASVPAGMTEIPESLFSGCSSLREIELPAGVTGIGPHAFGGCAGLTEIRLPEGLERIGGGAFAGCGGVSEIVVPLGVTSVGAGAFRPAASAGGALRDMQVYCEAASPAGSWETDWDEGCRVFWDYSGERGETADGWRWMLRRDGGMTVLGYAGTERALEVPSELEGKGVRVIGAGAFKDMTALQSVVIPDCVEEIGFGALEGCGNLESYTAPVIGAAGYTHFGSVFGAKGVGEQNSYVPASLKTVVVTADRGGGTFMGCQSVKKVVLPEGMAEIGANMFQNCFSLSEVALPASLTAVGEGAFANCLSLWSVTLPGGVHVVSPRAFAGCTNLASVVLEEGVTSVGAEAFSDCIRLSSVVLPRSLQTVERMAFGSTYYQAAFYYAGTESDWQQVDDQSGNNLQSKLYYYSETKPSDTGRYWHYADGRPVRW